MMNLNEQRRKATLRGITFGKNRGYVPLAATAERYRILHGTQINWERPYDFAHGDLEELSKTYDLLMIDHPHVGSAAKHRYLVPLDGYIPADYLKDQAENSVGKSHASYQYDGIQWGLATDVATPVPFYRPDLMEQKGEEIPATWEDLKELIAKGLATFPCDPTSAILNMFMLCDTQGVAPCTTETHVVDEDMGVRALRQLRELVLLIPENAFARATMASHEQLAENDDIAYCAFNYPYCNYSRRGFARRPLRFTNLVSLGEHGILHSTLGGAGLCVSVHSEFREVAVDYIQFATNPQIQRTLYCDNGGQPGHRSAWLDESCNAQVDSFFTNTLASHDAAYLRPCYNGFIYMQKTAGPIVTEYMRNGGNEGNALEALDEVYRLSLTGIKPD